MPNRLFEEPMLQFQKIFTCRLDASAVPSTLLQLCLHTDLNASNLFCQLMYFVGVFSEFLLPGVFFLTKYNVIVNFIDKYLLLADSADLC